MESFVLITDESGPVGTPGAGNTDDSAAIEALLAFWSFGRLSLARCSLLVARRSLLVARCSSWCLLCLPHGCSATKAEDRGVQYTDASLLVKSEGSCARGGQRHVGQSWTGSVYDVLYLRLSSYVAAGKDVAVREK